MNKKQYKKVLAIMLAAVMLFVAPCGVYASGTTQSMKVYQGSYTTATKGVTKTTTSYSNGSCTAVSGANAYCHIALWLLDDNGNVASDTSYYTMSYDSETIVYKSGYGKKNKKFYARASIQTGLATTSTTLTYRLTP